MALEVSNNYATKIRRNMTGKNLLNNLSCRISFRLNCNTRAVKIVLLKLQTFAMPGQHNVPESVGRDEWIDSMFTSTNLLGVKFADCFRVELKNANTWAIMDEIDALPKLV